MQAKWETKFLEHSSGNRCPLYFVYIIWLAQASFLLAQLKKHSHLGTGGGLVSLTGKQ